MAEELYFSPGNQSIAAGANITISTSGNTITIIGGVNSGATTFALGVSTDGNTAGTTGTVNLQGEFVGGNSITLSQSKNGQSATISIVGPTISESFGASNLGNTAGTSGIASGPSVRFLLQGGNNITLSQSINGASGTITIQGQTGTIALIGTAVKAVASVGSTGTITRYAPEDHQHAGVFSAGVSTFGNSAGSTAVLPGKLVLVGGNNITLSQSTDNSNGMSVSIVAGSEGTLSEWVPVDYGANTTLGQIGQGSLKMFPAILQHYGSFSLADIYGSVAQATNGPGNANFSGSLSISLGVYTKNASTLSLASSGSQSFSWQANSAASLSIYTGMRHFSVPIGLSMLPGNYWIGFLSSTTFSSKDNCTISNYGVLVAPAWVNDFGASQNATHQFMPGLGLYSTTTNALPSAIGFSDLVGSAASTIVPYMDLLNFNFT